MTVAFEADLDPDTGLPRVRMNFINGWTISIVLITPDKGRTRFGLASVACAPTGRFGQGETELLAHEAFADELASLVFGVSQRSARAVPGIGGRA